MTTEELERRIGQDFDGECHLTEAEARALLDRIASLETALAPFAKFARDVAAEHPGWDYDKFAVFLGEHHLTLEPFRRAAALSSSKKDGE